MSTSRTSRRHAGRAAVTLAASITASTLLGSQARANEQFGIEVNNVAAGEARFDLGSNAATIHAGHNTIINYARFDIGAGQSVQFVQPDATARVLNRVESTVPSRIDGAIHANGHVYLVNPAGLVFGTDAQVRTRGFTAAAANLSDRDFLAGRDRFTTAVGDIVNRGFLAADSVRMVGLHVENHGHIVGRDLVVMAAGENVYLQEKNARILVKIEGGANGERAGVEQAGHVESNKAVRIGVGDVYSLAFRHQGRTEAPHVRLGETASGRAEVDGTVSAAPRSFLGRGGIVEVLAEQVVINGSIDAGGALGGGSLFIGGGRGGHGDLPRADTVEIGQNAMLRADALVKGNGGEVILWSDRMTTFAGTASASGGTAGGGGFIETSGGRLAYTGRVMSDARNGREPANVLLDPMNIMLVNDFGLSAEPPFGTPAGNTSFIDTRRVEDLLEGGSDVTISTGFNTSVYEQHGGVPEKFQGFEGSVSDTDYSGDIIMNAPIQPELNNGDVTLTMVANRGIRLGADIIATGDNQLHVDLTSYASLRPDDQPGSFFNEGLFLGYFDRPIVIETNGGNLTGTGRNVTGWFENQNPREIPGSAESYSDTNYFGRLFWTSVIRTAGGDVTLDTGGGVLFGDIDTTLPGNPSAGGDITIIAGGVNYITGDQGLGEAVQLRETSVVAGGDLILRGDNVFLSGDALSGRNVTVEASLPFGTVRQIEGIDRTFGQILVQDNVSLILANGLPNDGGVTYEPVAVNAGGGTVQGYRTDTREPVDLPEIDEAVLDYLASGQRERFTFNSDGTIASENTGDDVDAHAYTLTFFSPTANQTVNAVVPPNLRVPVTADSNYTITAADTVTINSPVRVSPDYTLALAGEHVLVNTAIDGRAALIDIDASQLARLSGPVGTLEPPEPNGTVPQPVVPPTRVEVTAPAVELNSIFVTEAVVVDASDSIRFVGEQPAVATAGTIDFSQRPGVTTSDGSTPIIATEDFNGAADGRFATGFDLRRTAPAEQAQVADLPAAFFITNVADVAPLLEGYGRPYDVTFDPDPLSVAEAIAGAVPTEVAPEPERSPGVDAALRQELETLGVFARETPLALRRGQLGGPVIYDDVPPLPPEAEVQVDTYKVTDSRIAREAAEAAVASYSGSSSAVGEVIGQAFADYRAAAQASDAVEYDPAHLADFLRDRVAEGGPEAEQSALALAHLQLVAQLVDSLEAMGLGPMEFKQSLATVLGSLTREMGPAVNPEDLQAAAEGMN